MNITRYLGLVGVCSNSSDCNIFNVVWSFTILFCRRSLAFNSNDPNPGRSDTELPLVAVGKKKEILLFKNWHNVINHHVQKINLQSLCAASVSWEWELSRLDRESACSMHSVLSAVKKSTLELNRLLALFFPAFLNKAAPTMTFRNLFHINWLEFVISEGQVASRTACKHSKDRWSTKILKIIIKKFYINVHLFLWCYISLKKDISPCCKIRTLKR